MKQRTIPLTVDARKVIARYRFQQESGVGAWQKAERPLGCEVAGHSPEEAARADHSVDND